jgi:galactose mutarotase-like enzyme
MKYIVENKDAEPMPFACGGHTAYACPITKDTKLTDYVVEFPSQQSLLSNTLGASGLLSHQLREIESKDGILTLSETLFNQDALIFSNINWDWVRLRKKDAKKGILVRFKGYPNLALWSKPGADYLCIEPWLGLPDHEDESLDLTQKSTYKTIAPKEVFSIAIETEIE